MPRTRPLAPLPLLSDGRSPVISSGHKARNPGRPTHSGVDLMYPRKPQDQQAAGDGQGAERFIMPPGTVVRATEAGQVLRRGVTKTGGFVWIGHGPYQTGYFHLATLRPEIKPGARVERGQAIGSVGHNPADRDALHLHFEVSNDASAYRPIDPTAYVAQWSHWV